MVKDHRNHISGCAKKLVAVEAALAGLAVPSKRQEIFPSLCYQNQNHCLDDETFETFSYLRGLIERGGVNRTYLVKRLNHIRN